MKVNFAVGMGRNEKIYEIADHSRVAEESGFRHIPFGDVQNCTRDLYVKMALAATATHRPTPTRPAPPSDILFFNRFVDDIDIKVSMSSEREFDI